MYDVFVNVKNQNKAVVKTTRFFFTRFILHGFIFRQALLCRIVFENHLGPKTIIGPSFNALNVNFSLFKKRKTSSVFS